MFRWPELPRLVSESFLAELDKDPPGTWIAQPKIDGRRRVVSNIGGTWTWRAKNRGDAMPVPPDLRTAFESLPWPAGVTLDMEFSGPRHVNGTPELHVFDLLAVNDRWVGDACFAARHAWLTNMMMSMSAPHIYLVPAFINPGMVELYHRQRENPLCEGLVVRRATSTMKGSPIGCVESREGYYKVRFR